MFKNLFNRIFVLRSLPIFGTSKEVTQRINDFLDLSPEIIYTNQYSTFLRAGDLLLEVWTTNYSYGYAARGNFVKVKTLDLDKCMYPVVNGSIMLERDAYFKWMDKMPDATTLVRLKNYVSKSS